MCGITGFYSPSGLKAKADEEVLIMMRDQIIHRGPDGSGIWLDVEAGIGFAHRRLSILDTSSAGYQPMISNSGRYIIVFNGEIYNHLEIRAKLDASVNTCWHGTSDTESLLTAIDHWGLEKTIKLSVGMFSLALWDREERALYLCRDRMGEKPLYYGWQRNIFMFGSELKALRAHPSFENIVNNDVMPLYLRHGNIPAPFSIWKGIYKLLPGTILRINSSNIGQHPQPVPYWSFLDAVLRGQSNPFEGSTTDAINAVHQRLLDSVFDQMSADVPLGSFLSGGIDSSTIVSLMQDQSMHAIRTYTIGFQDGNYNEAEHAKDVAKHLGTDHTEIYVNSNQAQDVIPKLSNIYDEPFGDSSAIPTFLVSKLASRHVKVSLCGDGGDEIFGGYARYFKAAAIQRATSIIPTALRSTVSSYLSSPIPTIIDEIMNRFQDLGMSRRSKLIAPKCALLSSLIGAEAQSDFYNAFTSHWGNEHILGCNKIIGYGYSSHDLSRIADPIHLMMAQDSLTYLPDDILVKVDRSAMSVSLETRAPYLDHRVIELLWSLPFETKVKDGQGKWLLRQILKRYVPQKLTDRPKMGFGVPVDLWLRGPLREWAEDLLQNDQGFIEGYLDSKVVSDRWDQHLSAKYNWKDSLWLILMWKSWVRDIKSS